MIVLDASAGIELLRGTPTCGAWVLDRLRRNDDGIAVPHLFDAEVGHYVRRAALAGDVTTLLGRALVARLRALDADRWSHAELLDRAFQLRDDASFYDALYLALAERVNGTLVTTDARLAGVPGLRAVVEVVPASPAR